MSLLGLTQFNFQAPDILDFTVKYSNYVSRADDNSSSIVD